MESLNRLYQWLQNEGVFLFDRQLPFSNEKSKAVTIKLNATNDWGIFLDKGRIKTSAEEYAVMLHESGHYATGAMHTTSSPTDLIERHEYKADKWAVEHLLSADDLESAVAKGNTEAWQLAEYFSVTEDLIRKAVCYYNNGNLATELYC